jgi:hypothetical protein
LACRLARRSSGTSIRDVPPRLYELRCVGRGLRTVGFAAGSAAGSDRALVCWCRSSRSTCGCFIASSRATTAVGA